MDEATASIDEKTDETIQTMIRKEFKKVTAAINIDHRDHNRPQAQQDHQLRPHPGALERRSGRVRRSIDAAAQPRQFPGQAGEKSGQVVHGEDHKDGGGWAEGQRNCVIPNMCAEIIIISYIYEHEITVSSSG